MRYGELPKILGEHLVECQEMMFYQYLPIKLAGATEPLVEDRLKCFSDLIGAVCCDYVGEFGLDDYVESFIYLTAKRAYQGNGCSFNRKGYHSDGFMTDDINYIWYDRSPTIFNKGQFNLTNDDSSSMYEMEEQANPQNEVVYPINSLLRLNQFSIHKVADVTNVGLRTFVKISFSKDKYDLRGNSHNYLLDYQWEMRERKPNRNIPQKID